MKYKLYTADNYEGTSSLKQHAYVECERLERWWKTEVYEGNKIACGRGGLTDENEKFLPLSEIEDEPQRIDMCKKCFKLINKI